MSKETRTLICLTGNDTRKFLQDLITNDISDAETGLVYAALLTPQGKYLFDFFVTTQGNDYLIDIASSRADALVKRLTMYRLRADVDLKISELKVSRGVGDKPDGAKLDPRHHDLGWRRYDMNFIQDNVDWDEIRVRHLIPETDVELIADETYILETGFEALNGVDFRKGCYVGQEVTARMKHKTELRKGIARVFVSQDVPVGTPIIRDDKAVGKIYTQSNGQAIAYLRFDRAGDGMTAGDAVVSL